MTDDPMTIEAQARLAAIVESSDDAIVSKTLDGIIRTWNKGAERIFGYNADEVIGRPITILLPPDRQEEEPRILERLRAGERVDHYETVRVTKDGRHVDVSVTISPVKDVQGRVTGASKIARDVTAQKQLQRELQAAKEAAEAANNAKDRFLSVLSHELRTPLTPVLAAVSHIGSMADCPDELREEIEMIRRNVETEARLVDDLLDLTRISKGKMQLHFEVVDVHAAVRNVIGMVQKEMDTRSLELSVALRARQHHAWADSGRLQQVFLNLISNAVKFGEQGGTITIRSGNDDAGWLRVDVGDGGIGIEPDVMPRLFKAFEQGEQTTTRQFGGLGLGLSIAKALIVMHDGRIRAASEGKDKGATFTVELETVPAVPAPAPASEAGTRPKICRVLLVEDHEDTRLVMSRLLKSFGCTVTTAGNVRDALEHVERGEFDLLVSDIGLPDGSGLEVMQRVKDKPAIKGIALSGFGQAEDLRRSREAGFVEHLVKPVNVQTLQNIIQRVTN